MSDQDPLPAAFPLTLDQAIATSLDRNPTLVALRATQPVADAVCRVAHTYPFNPLVQLEVIPLDREPDGRQAAIKHYVYFLQTLEFAHQQRYREAGGEAGRIQVGWNVVAAELTAAAQAERLYFTALYQRDLRDLARLTASQNEELLRVIQDRSNAGSAKATELPTAEVAARQSRKQAALAEANFQTAVQALKRQLNVDGGEPIDLVGRLEDFNWLPTEGVEGASDPLAGPIRISSEVTAQLASERPDVLAAQAGASMAQANADLARANMVQNVQIGPYYERDELGTIFLGFRLQTNIPVWDTGRPLANQREAETVAQSVNLQQLRERAQVEAQTAIERYERARRLVARERADALKSIPEQLEQARRQFNANRVDVLYLFTLQNNLLQERRTYLDLLNELAQAAADVTLTAGLPPARIVSGRIPANPLPPDAPPAQ